MCTDCATLIKLRFKIRLFELQSVGEYTGHAMQPCKIYYFIKVSTFYQLINYNALEKQLT